MFWDDNADDDNDDDDNDDDDTVDGMKRFGSDTKTCKKSRISHKILFEWINPTNRDKSLSCLDTIRPTGAKNHWLFGIN